MHLDRRRGNFFLYGVIVVLIAVVAFLALKNNSQSGGGGSDPSATFDAFLLAGKFTEAADMLRELEARNSPDLPFFKASFSTRTFSRAEELFKKLEKEECRKTLDLLLKVVPAHPEAQQLRGMVQREEWPVPAATGPMTGVLPKESPKPTEPVIGATPAGEEKRKNPNPYTEIEPKAPLTPLTEVKPLPAETPAPIPSPVPATPTVKMPIPPIPPTVKAVDEVKATIEPLKKLCEELLSPTSGFEPGRGTAIFEKIAKIKALGDTQGAQELAGRFRDSALGYAQDRAKIKDFEGALKSLSIAEEASGDKKGFASVRKSISNQHKLFMQSKVAAVPPKDPAPKAPPIPTVSSPPTPDVKPGAIEVGTGKGNLVEAIANAPNGGEIHLFPGTYNYPSPLSKNLKFVGKGAAGQINWASDLGVVLRVTAGELTFDNISFNGRDPGAVDTVVVTGGTVNFIKCLFSSSSASTPGQYSTLLRVQRGQVNARESVFSQGRGMGLIFEEGSSVTMAECVIRGHQNFGIWIKGDAEARINHCQIHDNGMSGISSNSIAPLKVTGSEIRDNQHYGILLEGQGVAVCTTNRIHDNKINGVEGRDECKLSFQDNKIEKNQGYGILGSGPGVKVTLIGSNHFAENKTKDYAVEKGGQLEIK